MTVLHVVARLGGMGGAEASLAQILPGLQRRGVVSVVLPLDGRRWPDHDTLRMSGVRILPSPRSSWLPVQLLALRRAVAVFRPDVVHSCLWRPDLVTRLSTPRVVPTLVSLVNAQYSAEAYARVPSPRRLDMLRRLDGWLARHRTEGIHAITGAVAREGARALGLDEASITVVPRGRDGRVFRPVSTEEREAARRQLGVGDEPVVVNIARHEWQKGPIDLVEAFRHVSAVLPEALLLQVGRDGHASQALRSAVTALGSDNRFRLLGVRHDVPTILAAADLFLFSSRWEGLGGSVLEAMASGLPVVAFDEPAVREVLGGTGRLVGMGDAAALGREAASLLVNPALRAKLGAAARARFEDVYELEAVTDEMTSLYRAVARRRGRW